MATTLRTGPDEQGGLALSTPGFIILAHENFHRVAELARFLSLSGPVVIHVDRRVTAHALPDLGGQITIISTRAGEWGMIGLVDATLDAARTLLSRHDVSHVCLLSGGCLPIRPAGDFKAFLNANPGTDFIESVPVWEAEWIKGGLSWERFRFWFPVGWKRRRRLFDALVALQRRLGIERKMPDGLQAHLGLQWWCLTSETLESILNHPKLSDWRRYFAWNWIPDEGFFQTIVRHIGAGNLQSQTLTLQRFDLAGRPFVFHDDHRELLGKSGFFFARKVDPDASGLYEHFLADAAPGRPVNLVFTGELDETPFEAACERASQEGIGLLSASRMRTGTTLTHVETCRPYAVIVSSEAEVLRQVRAQYRDTEIRFHGRLFGTFPADFSGDFSQDSRISLGCLPTDPVQRDYRAAQFLARAIWVGRDRPTAFLFDPADNRHVRGQILSDSNARLILIGDAEDLLSGLAEPLQNKRGRSMKPPPRWAWVRNISPDASDLPAQALAALESDWENPAGWELPETGAPVS